MSDFIGECGKCEPGRWLRVSPSDGYRICCRHCHAELAHRISIWECTKWWIEQEYPPLRSLPWHERIRARLWGTESEITKGWQGDTWSASQSAVLVKWRGKEYVKRWGRLR